MRQSKKTLLIIDDDRLFCDSVKHGLTDLAVDVIVVGTGAEGIAWAANQSIDIVLLDQKLPDGNGIQFCSPLLESNESAKIIFITAFPSFENAVQAIKVGAYDYLSKPFEIGELHLAVSQALHTSALERVEQLQRFQQRQDRGRAILIGADGGLKHVQEMLEFAVNCRSPVLITGETGTGKTILAKAIHFRGKAAKEAFIPVNCAAIPENLIEAELFGHDKGAFTGAVSGNKGLFEMADQGTHFWMKSVKCPYTCRQSFWACWTTTAFDASAADPLKKSMSGSSQPPTRNWTRLLPSVAFAKIFIIVSAWFTSTCRP